MSRWALLLCAAVGCGRGATVPAPTPVDASVVDAGAPDGGGPDAGALDAGAPDDGGAGLDASTPCPGGALAPRWRAPMAGVCQVVDDDGDGWSLEGTRDGGDAVVTLIARRRGDGGVRVREPIAINTSWYGQAMFVRGTTVYAWVSDRVFANDTRDGHPLWRRHVAELIDAGFASRGGVEVVTAGPAGPLLVQLGATNPELVALAADTGLPLWGNRSTDVLVSAASSAAGEPVVVSWNPLLSRATLERWSSADGTPRSRTVLPEGTGIGAVAGDVTLAMSWNADRKVMAVHPDGGVLRLGDAGMFPSLPVLDGRMGWGVDVGWLHRFDVERGLVTSIPLLGEDGGRLYAWEPFLLDDGAVLVFAASELRRYRTDGTLEWSCPLAEPLPEIQPATALGPGVLYLWRTSRVLEAYELPVMPAEHGWVSQRGSRRNGNSGW